MAAAVALAKLSRQSGLGVNPWGKARRATVHSCARHNGLAVSRSGRQWQNSYTNSPSAGSLRWFSAVVNRYKELTAKGSGLSFDQQQFEVVAQMQTLADQLRTYRPPNVSASAVLDQAKPKKPASSGGGLGSLFNSFLGAPSKDDSATVAQSTLFQPPGPKGIYLHGSPGCGKTFLMDMFYEVAAVNGPKKRVHFNSFMLGVHERLHALRKSLIKGDPIPPLADQLKKEAILLCFDEFQVLDIADAMTIRRLFDLLFRMGVVMVATSNRPPEELYKNGLQRELFVPFIQQLPEACTVIDLDSKVDYRALGTRLSNVYFHPLDQSARADMDAAFKRVIGKGLPEAMHVKVMQGRTLYVPSASYGVARFDFHDLCGRPLGAADYLALTENFHTVFLDGVPILKAEQRNEIRRFITLIDELYQAKIRLVCSAEALPEQLLILSGSAPHEEVFAFERCVSRLNELRSEEYRDKIQSQIKAKQDAWTQGHRPKLK